jgi:hypothetical protein
MQNTGFVTSEHPICAALAKVVHRLPALRLTATIRCWFGGDATYEIRVQGHTLTHGIRDRFGFVVKERTTQVSGAEEYRDVVWHVLRLMNPDPRRPKAKDLQLRTREEEEASTVFMVQPPLVELVLGCGDAGGRIRVGLVVLQERHEALVELVLSCGDAGAAGARIRMPLLVEVARAFRASQQLSAVTPGGDAAVTDAV